MPKPKAVKTSTGSVACPTCSRDIYVIQRVPGKATCKFCHIEFDVASEEAE